MSALAFLRKAVRVRRQLIRSGKSYQPLSQMESALEPIERWLKFWNGKATDEGALVIIRKYELNVREIIPGGQSGCGQKMTEELESILKQHHTTMKQFNFVHEGVHYRALFTVDETNQAVNLNAIQLTTDKTNLIGIVSIAILQSLKARLEAEHLTHAA